MYDVENGIPECVLLCWCVAISSLKEGNYIIKTGIYYVDNISRYLFIYYRWLISRRVGNILY